MKSWIFWLALLISTPFASATKAQSLFTVVSFYADPDSLIINEATGDTLIHYHVQVANIGDAGFIGVFKLEATYVNTGISEDWWIHTFTPLDIFAAHDTLDITIDDVVLPTTEKYDGGGDVIVVWPNADGAMTLNGDTTTVYIDGIISVDPPTQIDGRATPFPNPSTGTLNIDWGTHQNLFESVSIVDMAGREWRFSSKVVNTVDLTGLPQGIYFLKVSYTDGVRETYKLRIQGR
jgi:hypothetical protein